MPQRLPFPALALLALALASPAFAYETADETAPPAAPPAADAPAATKAEAAAPEWFGDFDKATERARAEKKDLLVDFTGSDWCHWCIKLHEEVLGQEAFLTAAARDYVLVSLDFPHAPEVQARVPNMARNRELAQKYAIEGYPTVLLMTADGDVFARTGYAPGGAEKYVASMATMREKGRPALLAATALAKEFDAAAGDARIAVVEKALAVVEKAAPGDAWVEKLVPAAKAALTLDPDNARGLKLRGVGALLRGGVADAAVLDAARKLDPKNEKGVLEHAVMAQISAVRDEESCKETLAAIEALDGMGIKDGDIRQVCYANAAFWHMQLLQDKEKAAVWAKKLKAIADPENPQFKRLIEAVLGAETPDAGAPKDEGAK